MVKVSEIILGYKTKELYNSFIKNFIPDNIQIYCEPFGGCFCVHSYLPKKPKLSIYNDINVYNIDINADILLHLDYKEVFNVYDSIDTVWYLDPPYYKKEFLYKNCEDYTEYFHINLKHNIDNLIGSVIISYEDNKFIKKLYKDYNIHEYSGSRIRFKNEIIITKK
jgi:site-specific DNA-adenine methylase